jgi:hypothetical protein
VPRRRLALAPSEGRETHEADRVRPLISVLLVYIAVSRGCQRGWRSSTWLRSCRHVFHEPRSSAPWGDERFAAGCPADLGPQFWDHLRRHVCGGPDAFRLKCATWMMSPRSAAPSRPSIDRACFGLPLLHAHDGATICKTRRHMKTLGDEIRNVSAARRWIRTY